MPDYEFLLKGLNNSKKSIGTDKGLAKIGDSIVNLIYSVAKSIYLTKIRNFKIAIRTGKKVNQIILSNALKNAGFKGEYAKSRANAHDMADTVEALVAYVWLRNKISIEEMIDILVNNFKGEFNERKQEIEAAINAFTELLIKIIEIID
ncbi:MAG: ribonuclease III family protein [Promethearchaeota archaeon]